MSYLVIARKFRPQTFAQVSGQEHVTRTLANSIRRDRVAHAYLFAGPRGVGKTSIARIFAKALNCREGPTPEPCTKCTNCIEITQGNNIAVREIDGASHNSVDNVRELIESFRGLPPPGSRYKIYIIDEVHMFSTAAFNALLKSLEEPPPNTIFILATTEAHKIPETVISRCQRHDFRSLIQGDIEARLTAIAEEEGMQVEPEALRMIARLSEGSMRDAQSLLERVNAFCDGAISAANASIVLGTVERSILSRLSQAILARDAGAAIDLVAEVYTKGVDPGLFLREFATHFREILIARFGGEAALVRLGIGEADRVELLRQAGSVSQQDVQDLVHLARQGCDGALRSAYPKYALEALVVRMSTREPAIALAEVLSSIRSGKAALSAAAPSSGAAPSVQAPVARVAPAAADYSEQSQGRSSAGGARGASAAVPAAIQKSEAQSVPAAAAAGARSELDWPAFVRESAEHTSRMVTEHLKRLSLSSFQLVSPSGNPADRHGVLEAVGAAFSIESLSSPENKKKLEAALEKFTGVSRWFLKLALGGEAKAGGGNVEFAASVRDQEQAHQRRTKAEKQADISNHPKIKNLQKMFPGTQIETITIKEE